MSERGRQNPFAPRPVGHVPVNHTTLNGEPKEIRPGQQTISPEREFRAFQMLELRLQGYNVMELAQYFDMPVIEAQRYLSAGLDHIRTEYALGVENLREIEARRTEAMIREHWGQIGNVKNAELVLKIMEHRNKLLGLAVKGAEEDNPAEALRQFLAKASENLGVQE